MRPTDLTLWYDFINNPGHESRDGRGPTLTNLRAGPAIGIQDNVWSSAYYPPYESRFHGAYRLANIFNPDATGPEWSTLGMSGPEVGFRDPFGGSKAYRFMSDTSDSEHSVAVECVLPHMLNPPIATNQLVWVKAEGNARYIVVGLKTPFTLDELAIIDTQLGDVTVFDVYYHPLGYSGSLSMGDIGEAEGGWYSINLGWASWSTHQPPKVVVGLSDAPDTSALSFPGQTNQGLLVYGALGTSLSYTQFPRQEGPVNAGVIVDDHAHYMQYMLNGYLEGASNGVPPTSGYYNDMWSVPAGQTGTGTTVPTLYPIVNNPWQNDKNIVHNAIHCECTNETYRLKYDVNRWPAGDQLNYGQLHVLSIRIEDIVTQGTGPVIVAEGWNRTVFPNGTSKTLADAVDGVVEITFIPHIDDYTSVDQGVFYIGAGADGVNDTTDFIWSTPSIHRGEHRYEPLGVTDNGEWFGSKMSAERAFPIERELLRGLLVEPETLNEFPVPQTDPGAVGFVVLDPVNTRFRAPWASGIAYTYSRFSVYMNNGAHTAGLIDVGMSGPIVVKPDTLYTVTVPTSWINSNTTINETFFRVILTHAGQDIDMVVQWTVAGWVAPSVVHTGADVLSILVEREDNKWSNFPIIFTFRSDAVITDATFEIRIVSDQWATTNQVDPTNWGSAFFLDSIQLISQPEVSSRIFGIDTAHATREADVVKTADLQWFNREKGVIYMDLRTPGLGFPRYTAVSIDDNASTNRISLEIIDGVMHFRGVRNGLGQWDIPFTPGIAEYNTFSDDFERVDGPMGAQWTDVEANDPYYLPGQIINGQLGLAWSVSDNAVAALVDRQYSPDHFAECTVGEWTLTEYNNAIQLFVRASFGARLDWYGLYVSTSEVDDGLDFWLYRNDDGSSVVINDGWYPGERIATGDVIRLEVMGNTLRTYLNGALKQEFTDTNLPGGQYIGCGVDEYATASDASIEDFNGGNVRIGLEAKTDYKVAMQYEENAVYLFIDGVFIGSDTDCEIPLGLVTLHIGCNWNDEQQLNSTIAELQGYRNTLTQIELQTLSTGQTPCR